ncbi:MAG TPA: hypothetical protein V6C91_21180 [Coleofasciculaceae cyanobacterium]
MPVGFDALNRVSNTNAWFEYERDSSQASFKNKRSHPTQRQIRWG